MQRISSRSAQLVSALALAHVLSKPSLAHQPAELPLACRVTIPEDRYGPAPAIRAHDFALGKVFEHGFLLLCLYHQLFEPGSVLLHLNESPGLPGLHSHVLQKPAIGGQLR